MNKIFNIFPRTGYKNDQYQILTTADNLTVRNNYIKHGWKYF